MDINAKDYQSHNVFDALTYYAGFYEMLSFSIMGFSSTGTLAAINIDTSAYTSMQGTLESIQIILRKGRINDAYALLRKYHDSVVINVYANLYLEDNCTLENLIVENIVDWIKGKRKLPTFSQMMKYISSSAQLAEINGQLSKDDRYMQLRRRCNGHMHYNLYYNVLLNDNEIHLHERVKVLESIRRDLEDVFILHMVYTFNIHPLYMMASDYIDCLDMGLTPKEGSQYYVAPFIQEIFDRVITKNRPDLAAEIKRTTSMELK